MEKINKLSLPISIVIASIIIGAFYYTATLNKQKFNEAQQKSDAVGEEKIPTKIEPKYNTGQQLITNKALQDVRNAQRRSDVLTILNAIYQYSLDNNGNIPSGITTSPNCTVSSTDALSLKTQLVGNKSIYLASIPIDPLLNSVGNSSGYYVTKNLDSNRITVCAPNAEGVGISVTR